MLQEPKSNKGRVLCDVAQLKSVLRVASESGLKGAISGISFSPVEPCCDQKCGKIHCKRF